LLSVPDEQEMINCMIWRQQDATRNSVEQYGRSMYSHTEMMNKNNAQVQDMMMAKGFNWNDAPTWTKRGVVVTKEKIDWEIPIFTQDKDYLSKLYRPIEETQKDMTEVEEVAAQGSGKTE